MSDSMRSSFKEAMSISVRCLYNVSVFRLFRLMSPGNVYIITYCIMQRLCG